MRILLCSHVFSPNIGGIETVSGILASEFCRLGETVTVVTSTAGDQVSAPFQLVRRPSARRLRELARDSDIVFLCQISLRTLLPLLFSTKPTFIAHHGRLTRTNGRRGWQDYLKFAVLPRYHNISISQAIASALPVNSVVIGNPFEPGEFKDWGADFRTRDIVFMGRLVPDKGCEVLIRALAMVKAEGLFASLTIIGDGPEMPFLKRLTAALGLSDQVSFPGILREGRGKEVARHRIMVIPSTCKEGFGVVALEGIAAGCAVIASQVGGLPEAVGQCGVLFPCGDVAALAAALKGLLENPKLRDQLSSRSSQHLERFQPETVARQYLKVFESALPHGRGPSESVSVVNESHQ